MPPIREAEKLRCSGLQASCVGSPNWMLTKVLGDSVTVDDLQSMLQSKEAGARREQQRMEGGSTAEYLAADVNAADKQHPFLHGPRYPQCYLLQEKACSPQLANLSYKYPRQTCPELCSFLDSRSNPVDNQS